MGVGPGKRIDKSEEGQQDKICLPNVWAKAESLLICGACYEDGEGDICLMLTEPETARHSQHRQ